MEWEGEIGKFVSMGYNLEVIDNVGLTFLLWPCKVLSLSSREIYIFLAGGCGVVWCGIRGRLD